MGYEPLHHKYRPQTFADLVGQEAIATTLTNAIKTQRIAPAYLLTGARGTGKTSTARIIAKSLNCRSYDVPTPTPCGQCDLCRGVTAGNALDITEIDAASNTGVDNIRELIERAQFAPVQARYKVYAIDECHMLSTAAFNALLKTLEEPPDRVVFILATTDPQRVLSTIISRCQRFDFRRIPLEAMVSHLQKIADIEGIPINPEAMMLVAQIAQGGLRDAESLLDQLSLMEGEITVEAVWDLVGTVPERDLLTLIEAIAQDNSTLVLEQVRRVLDRGREPIIVLQSLAGMYRDLLIAKTASDRRDLVALTASSWERLQQIAAAFSMPHILAGQQHLRSAEVQVKNTTQPRLWLEVTLLGLLPSATLLTTNVAASNSAPSKAIAPAPPITPSNTTRTQPPGNSQTENLASVTSSAASSHAPSDSTNVNPTNDATSTPPHQIPASDRESANLPSEPSVSAPKDLPIDIPETHTNLPESSHPLTADLEASWQELMTVLPPAPRGLLAEHGRFIEVTETTVKIGLKNATFRKIAEPKRDEVAKSCEKVFKRPMQVVFEVIGTKAAAKKTMTASPSVMSSTTPSPPPPATRSDATLSPQPRELDARPASDRSIPHQLNGDRPTQKLLDSPASPAHGYGHKSPEELAIKNIADFFNGQIINLDAEPSTEEQPSS